MRILQTGVLVVASLLLPSSSQAQGTPKPTESMRSTLREAVTELDRSALTVVAEVGPRVITWGDVADAIRAQPPSVSSLPFPTLYQTTTIRLAEKQALVLLGQADGLDKDPVVVRQMRAAGDQVLADAVLRRSLSPNITDNALHALYEKHVAGKAGPEEVQARIIMVHTQEEADTLLGRLRDGAQFGDLARDFSQDGTAANGGDLGYARLDMFEPALGAVIFALAPGQSTAYPVRVDNAYFLVRVEGRRQPPPPSFESARPALERDVIHLGVPELMRAALKVAPVKYYGVTGKAPPAMKN